MKQHIALLFSILLGLAGVTQAQMTTFSRGDILSAETMNNNFKFLKSVASGEIKETTVDCTTGTINEAISKGFNSIVIKGTCTENLNYYNWHNFYDESNPARQLSYLKLAGFDSDAKIVAESDSLPVILTDGTTLVIDNLTIQGGMNGISGYRNANVLLSGVTVTGFTRRGIQVGDSSYLGIRTTATITGSNANSGLYFVNQASGWVNEVNINDVETGISLYGSSSTYINRGTINARNIGVNASTSKLLHTNGEGESTLQILGVSERGIGAWDGSVIANWSGTTLNIESSGEGVVGGSGSLLLNNGVITISNTTNHALALWAADFEGTNSGNITINNINSGNAISADRANLQFSNLNITGLSSGGTSPLVSIGKSVISMQNSIIKDHIGGGNLIYIYQSQVDFDNLTASNSGGEGILASQSSISLRNSSVFNNSKNGIYISGSQINVDNSIIESNSNNGIDINEGSQIKVNNSIIESNSKNGIYINKGSQINVNNSIIESNSKNGIDIRRNSVLTFEGGEGEAGNSITQNGANGVIATQNVIIEIYGSTTDLTNNGSVGLMMGPNAEIDIDVDGAINTESIECWSTTDYNKPAIGFETQSSFTGSIGDGCLTWTRQ